MFGNLKRYLSSSPWKKILASILLLGTGLYFAPVLAETTLDLGAIAAKISTNFSNLAKLITGVSYIAGLGFSIGAIMKFKQHKDNPTQIPVGTPIALIFIAAALLFLPSLLGVAGQTVFGTGATVAGPGGVVFGAEDAGTGT